jgi:hypothetical protein
LIAAIYPKGKVTNESIGIIATLKQTAKQRKEVAEKVVIVELA